ncbi:response regulator [Bacillus sp. FSL K6-3431]|uniref:response regulator n=1 Tax=Bacillus sp. FSL K6-3431 TaxID=2921500 RepID=UPI0030F8C09C
MIRIVIAEDEPMMLGTLGSLINLEADMEVIGTASNGEEAISLVQQNKPDVCIMDNDMPGKSAIEAAEVLKDEGCKIIILTTFARSGFVELALKGDVSGYLLKDSPSHELMTSIRSIVTGARIYASELNDNVTSEEDPIAISEKTKLELVADCEDAKENTQQIHGKSRYMRNYFSHIFNKRNIKP